MENFKKHLFCKLLMILIKIDKQNTIRAMRDDLRENGDKMVLKQWYLNEDEILDTYPKIKECLNKAIILAM